jgi:hypothetical protein
MALFCIFNGKLDNGTVIKPLQRQKFLNFQKVAMELPIRRYTVIFAFWHIKVNNKTV